MARRRSGKPVWPTFSGKEQTFATPISAGPSSTSAPRRSGLVDSPLASEGTRTGFYTDDFDEQTFQSPEQIRKANLRDADLRGAKIDGVDFYLVDLRGAKYDPDQLEHFRRCRAILVDRE